HAGVVPEVARGLDELVAGSAQPLAILLTKDPRALLGQRADLRGDLQQPGDTLRRASTGQLAAVGAAARRLHGALRIGNGGLGNGGDRLGGTGVADSEPLLTVAPLAVDEVQPVRWNLMHRDHLR